jgi:Icc-related predicted phosphoesterase
LPDAVRIAAVADLHAKEGSGRAWRRGLEHLPESVDVLLLGGDLTDHGRPGEAKALAEGLAALSVPVLAVLGNHDHEHGAPEQVREILASRGVRVLEGESCVLAGVGFAGTKGFGGGFGRYALGYWGEAALKGFVAESRREADALAAALGRLRTRQRVALVHYAPIVGTLAGEPTEIQPFLGSERLGEALERGGATLACHGHAHAGSPEGATPGGIPVYNVAAPVLGATDPARIGFRLLDVDPNAAASAPASAAPDLALARVALYAGVLRALREAGVPHLVGGGVALGQVTDVARRPRDLDLLLRRRDLDAARAALEAAGHRTELPAPHWLAKAFDARGHFVDLIFDSGNGVCPIDDLWFERATPGEVLGQPVLVCPVEELIWTKAFVMERERYDGADVAHLILAHAERIDWGHLLRRFGPHWRVLLSHLVLFGFVYPGERARIPEDVMEELLRRLRVELATNAGPGVCQGGLLSRAQYLADFGRGYRDARERPLGPLAPEEIAVWTRGIEPEDRR